MSKAAVKTWLRDALTLQCVYAVSGAPALEGAAETRVVRAARTTGRLLGRLDLITARIAPWAVLGRSS